MIRSLTGDRALNELARVTGLPLEAHGRDAETRALYERGEIVGVISFSRVPLAHLGYEIHCLWVRPGDGAVERVTRLLTAIRDEVAARASAHVRFIGGAVQRGGLDPHLLEAAGLERRGRVPSFYGPDDDLLVYAASFNGGAATTFDPQSSAALYDAAFAYRDFTVERDFLYACARAHGTRVQRVASWACASGRHVQAFADLGVDGVGIDDNDELIELARRLAPGAQLLVAPLDRPVAAEPVELSFIMLSAVHRLATERAIVAHLRAAAALLAPGGVHVIEATHPRDLETTRTVAWTELRDGYSVQSRFTLDAQQATSDGTIPATLDVRCADAAGAVVATLQQQERWLVPDRAGWERIVALAGRFEIAALLGDFQLDVTSEQDGAWRMILVLRRT